MDNFMAAITMAANQIEIGHVGDEAVADFDTKMTELQFIELCQVRKVVTQLVFNHMRFRK